jgi:hypothetical protein
MLLLRCMSPLLALSRHSDCCNECPLSGVKRTLQFQGATSASDHLRHWGTVPAEPPNSNGCGVEEEVDRGDFALADDDEIDTGIGGWTFRRAGYPVDAARVVQLLRAAVGM